MRGLTGARRAGPALSPEVDVALYPDEANSYDCLAEAWLKSGDRDNAIKYHRQALVVDSDFENARKMLAQIEE